MIAKILCCGVVVCGCGYMGAVLGKRYVYAARQTGEFADALKMLEFDVSFLKLPAKEAFLRVNFSKDNTVKKIFVYMAKALEKNDCKNMCDIFCEAIKKYSEDVFISEFSKDTIYNFFKSFGTLDRENEIANIKSAYTKLRFAEEEEASSADEKSKFLKKTGFLAGIFLAIMLF